MANWLTDILGPTPAPQTVSMTRTGAPTPPSGGGGIPGFNVNDLLARMDSENAASNNAGIARYRNLMMMTKGLQNRVVGQGGLYDQAAGLQQNMGDTQNAAIDEATIKNKGTSEQDLISRGLGNTTVRSSVNRGIESDAQKAHQSVAESVANAKAGLLTQRAGAEQSIGGMRADALLSRTDTPPNAQMYAQLLQQLAANGGMGGANFQQGGSSATPGMGGGYGGGGGGGSSGGGSGGRVYFGGVGGGDSGGPGVAGYKSDTKYNGPARTGGNVGDALPGFPGDPRNQPPGATGVTGGARFFPAGTPVPSGLSPVNQPGYGWPTMSGGYYA